MPPSAADLTPEEQEVERNETDQELSDSAANNPDTVRFIIDNPYPTDRGLYPAVIESADLRYMPAKHGPCQPKGPFPAKVGSGRKFSTARYEGCNKAGIKIHYRWLSYSPTLDSVFCHPCWLFADRLSKSFRSEWIDGISDWGHLSQQIN